MIVKPRMISIFFIDFYVEQQFILNVHIESIQKYATTSKHGITYVSTGQTSFNPHQKLDKNDIELVCLFEKLLGKVQYTLNHSILMNIDGNMCMKLNEN